MAGYDDLLDSPICLLVCCQSVTIVSIIIGEVFPPCVVHACRRRLIAVTYPNTAKQAAFNDRADRSREPRNQPPSPPHAVQEFLHCLANPDIRESLLACASRGGDSPSPFRPPSQAVQEFLHGLANPDIRESLLACASRGGDSPSPFRPPSQAVQELLHGLANPDIRESLLACASRGGDSLSPFRPPSQAVQEFLHGLANPDVRESLLVLASRGGRRVPTPRPHKARNRDTTIPLTYFPLLSRLLKHFTFEHRKIPESMDPSNVYTYDSYSSLEY